MTTIDEEKFKKMDTGESDGVIDKAELKKALISLNDGEEVSDPEVDYVFTTADNYVFSQSELERIFLTSNLLSNIF